MSRIFIRLVLVVVIIHAVPFHTAKAERNEAKSAKVSVCHNRGNSGKTNTLVIAAKAAATHVQQHGDYYGACPVSIGKEGGIIEVAGEARIVIPPGAIASSIDISIERIAGEPGAPGAIYDFQPDGASFAEPITISIDYDPELLPESVDESELYLSTQVEGGFGFVENSFADAGADRVVGESTHFTEFAIDWAAVGCSDEFVVTETMFDSRVAMSFRMPIGDNKSEDVTDLSLLDTESEYDNSLFTYPNLTFNKNGAAANRWYAAATFNTDRALEQYGVTPVADESSHYCFKTTCNAANKRVHPGEDWNLTLGGATDEGLPVHAIANGIVLFSGVMYGNTVIVGHRLPDGSYVASFYGHLEEPAGLCKGQPVDKGHTIGAIGNTWTKLGSNPKYVVNVGSPHLHFEIGQYGQMIQEFPQGVGQPAEVDLLSGRWASNPWDSEFLDPTIIGERKHNPSVFVRDHAGNVGRYVEGRMTGSVVWAQGNNGAVVPGGISVGESVEIKFSYDLEDAVGTPYPNDPSRVDYRFPAGRPSGMDITIKNLTWSTGGGFTVIVTNDAGPNDYGDFYDSFSMYSQEYLSFPGFLGRGRLPWSFREIANPAVLLSDTDLPNKRDDLNLEFLDFHEAQTGVVISTDGNQWWQISYEIDLDSFSLGSTDDAPPPPGDGAQYVSFVEGDPGIPGDGLYVYHDGVSDIPTRHLEAFELTTPLEILAEDEGITVTLFPQSSAIFSLDHDVLIWFSAYDGTPNQCGLLSTWNRANYSYPNIRGTAAISLSLPASDYSFLLGIVCPNVGQLDDFDIKSISIIDGRNLQGTAYPLDAAAIGRGLHNHPE